MLSPQRPSLSLTNTTINPWAWTATTLPTYARTKSTRTGRLPTRWSPTASSSVRAGRCWRWVDISPPSRRRLKGARLGGEQYPKVSVSKFCLRCSKFSRFNNSTKEASIMPRFDYLGRYSIPLIKLLTLTSDFAYQDQIAYNTDHSPRKSPKAARFSSSFSSFTPTTPSKAMKLSALIILQIQFK